MILIFGAKGLVGFNIVRELQNKNYNVIPLDKSECDITDKNSVVEIISQYKPEIIINCAAYLNADRCQDNYELSYKVNYEGVVNIVKAINACSPFTILFHFSSDFVFDGIKGNYNEEDIPNPINIYGVHKIMADEIIKNLLKRYYIFRISSVLAYHPLKNNFLKTIISKGSISGRIEVVEDLKISISTAELITKVLNIFLEKLPEFGLYNVVAKGFTSWFEVAKYVFNYLDIPCQVVPIPSSRFTYKAPRPKNSTLVVEKLEKIMPHLPSWKEAIEEHLEKNIKLYLNLVGGQNEY